MAMVATKRKTTMPSIGPATLDGFFAATRDSNPFSSNRVSEPSSDAASIDVTTIHDDEYRNLLRRAREAHDGAQAVGVMLLGAAGIGKSHLLARLWKWGEKEDQAVYVFLHNLLASPERLPRYLLRSVIGLLTNGRRCDRNAKLYVLMHAVVKRALKEAKVSKRDLTWENCRAAFERLTAPLTAERRAFDVLLQFFRVVNLRNTSAPMDLALAEAAVDWLAGDGIDADTASCLGIPVAGAESVALQDDQDIEQVLIALAELASLAGRPFVLCLDQVDNLDHANIRSLFRFLHALIDHAQNLLVVTSGVRESMLELEREGVIPEAAAARVAQYRIELRRVRPPGARQILESRLERFLEPFVELPRIHSVVQEETLFPLGLDWFSETIGSEVELRPRRVLTWARDRWEDQQILIDRLGADAWLAGWPHPQVSDAPIDEPLEAAIDRAVNAKVHECIAQRKLHKGSLPPDDDNLSQLAETLLRRCLDRHERSALVDVERTAKSAGDKSTPYHLLVRTRRTDGKEERTGVTFVCTRDGRVTRGVLRRMEEDGVPPDLRLLVTDEERAPLSTSETTRKHYGALARLGSRRFRHIKLDFDGYAQLDAMASVIAMAQVGDLDVEHRRGVVRPVTEVEVVESLRRCDRLLQHPLLRELLAKEEPEPAETPAPVDPATKFDRDDLSKAILHELGWRFGVNASEIAKVYIRSHPDLDFEGVRAAIRDVAERMHQRKQLHATPHNEELFLQYRQ